MPAEFGLRSFSLRAGVFLFVMAARAAWAGENVEGILKLVPPDAQAGVVVPSLKSLSDQITGCLEGMDRANLLMGTRPVDQLKSATGFNVAVDDLGSAAMILVNDEEPPTPLFIVPVTDAAAFLQGNFVKHDGDSHSRADGETYFAKVLQKHVVLTRDAKVLAAYQPGEGIGASLQSSLGERASAVFNAGEVFVFTRQGVARQVSTAMKQQAAAAGQALPLVAVGGFQLIDSLEQGILVLDFDALGLIVHSLARFNAAGSSAAYTAGGVNAIGAAPGGNAWGLNRLPSKPFYLAASVDVAGLGGPAVMQAIAKSIGAKEVPQWMLQADQIQFAAYPSPAGPAGGLLNDSLTVLRMPQPVQAKAFFKEQVLGLKQRNDGITREVKWEEEKPIKDAGTADAYEVKVTNAPPEFAQQQMVSTMIFGSQGWRGFARDTDDALLMTFSQRPAVWQAAMQACTNGKADPKAGLASNAAIRMMRQWMPPHVDVELYLGVGPLGRTMKQALDALGAAGQVAGPLPELDDSLPPIGFGMEINDHIVETATIVPAGVLAVMMDQATQISDVEAEPPARTQP